MLGMMVWPQFRGSGGPSSLKAWRGGAGWGGAAGQAGQAGGAGRMSRAQSAMLQIQEKSRTLEPP